MRKAREVWRATIRITRSVGFLLVYFGYLMVVVGLGQRLVIWPVIVLQRRWRQPLVTWWLRWNARTTLTLANIVAGVKVCMQGAIPAESCVVVMNHQSVLDIPIGLSLFRGPYPLLPTRDRYRRGIPGVSPLTRLAKFPIVSQGRSLTREELAAFMGAAEQVARGENSLLIFAEGHRSRDGAIGPFMKSGLKLVFRRAKRPVYAVVVDGMGHSRRFADAFTGIAGTTVYGTILGPFPPPETAGIDAFIDDLHAKMSDALAQLREQPRAE